MGKSSDLYLKRKQHTFARLYPRPWFATNTLRTHSRPHTTLPELRDLESPDGRLATVSLELTKEHTYTAPDLSDYDPDFL